MHFAIHKAAACLYMIMTERGEERNQDEMSGKYEQKVKNDCPLLMSRKRKWFADCQEQFLNWVLFGHVTDCQFLCMMIGHPSWVSAPGITGS